MPLVNLKPVLREAKAKGYAVAAFNPVDYSSMKAMVKAAEELNAPVIIQSSAKTIKHYGHAAIIGWMREIAGESPVPVVLHLDHGKDLDMIKKCVEMGWTSVMIDWSDKPFQVNLDASRKVVEMATMPTSASRQRSARSTASRTTWSSMQFTTPIRARPSASAASSISPPSLPRSARRTATTRASRT
jgi:hypothetical protein